MVSAALVSTLVGLAASNLGILPFDSPAYSIVLEFLLPISIPLLLFGANLQHVVRSTGTLLLAFLLGSVASIVGTLVAFLIVPMRSLGPDNWKIAAALMGSYIGGSVNYVAISEALGVSASVLAAGVAADNVICAIYFMVLFALASKIPAEAAAPTTGSTQRWTPTPVQLQILERMFDQGNGTPNKEKIKEITAELRQHGHISETNVYNWFQNRRARSKRKLQDVTLVNTESEVENEVGCKDKKTIPEEYRSQHNVTTGAEKLCFQNPQVCSDLQYLNPDSNKPYSMFSSDGSLTSSRDLSPVPIFDEVLSNTITEHKPSGVVGDIYSDPLIHKRWTPTHEQLQILGRIFEEGKGKRITNKEKIKEITAELRQHGQISERNVYIWFQNKRAPLKRKQPNVTDVAEGNSESEIKNEEYLITKKIKKNEEYQSQPNITTCDEQLCFQNPEEDLQFLYSDSYVPDSMFCYEICVFLMRCHQTQACKVFISKSFL